MPFSSPGNLADPGIKPASPALQADYLPLRHQALFKLRHLQIGEAFLNLFMLTSLFFLIPLTVELLITSLIPVLPILFTSVVALPNN